MCRKRRIDLLGDRAAAGRWCHAVSVRRSRRRVET
jgi:hypothetical protein